MQLLTFDDLKQKWAESLLASEKAIYQRYPTYRELKRLVHRINTQSLDVAEYYPTAVRLGSMLRDISFGFSNTLFHYFADHIDPGKKGDVRCFRMECQQLSEQLAELDQHRASRGCLRIIPRAPSATCEAPEGQPGSD